MTPLSNLRTHPLVSVLGWVGVLAILLVTLWALPGVARNADDVDAAAVLGASAPAAGTPGARHGP